MIKIDCLGFVIFVNSASESLRKKPVVVAATKEEERRLWKRM